MVWDVTITNIAGIRDGSATIEPGINAIRGTNWQGKSSFVTAIETGMGVSPVLTEGEDHGRVEITTDETTATVELVRENGTVVQRGTPLVDDEKTRVAISLYSFLDEDNEVREAVRNGENLEAVLTRPLEFENLDERIADLSTERDRVETELARARDAAEQLPEAQRTVRELESELDELTDRRETVVEERGSTPGTSEHRDELSDAIAERDSLESRIERLERTVERTREKIEEKETELDSLDVPEIDEDLGEKIATSEERYTKLERDAELLQSIYAPTKRLLDEDRLDLITDVEHGLMEDAVTCWTCSEATNEETIAENLADLGERITELRSEAAEHRDRVDELREKREDHERAKRRISDLEAETSELEAKLEDRVASLDTARDRREALESRIDELSEKVEESEDELTDLESQIKYTRSRLDDARDELDSLETRADQRDQLDDEYDALTEEIHDLRDRKERIKQRMREAFDEAIQDLLQRFDVGFEMVRLTSNFDLVVARDGREASLDALSEGELELLGVIACLAGYEAFDVTDDVPIMLLDGLGGLADGNLRTLIEFLDQRVDYLVFTTYPENTEFEGHTIDPTEWDVVSPETDPVATSD